MPGTFVFRPIEANLTHNTDLLTKMSPYCSFIVGEKIVKGPICNKGGKHPQWNDAITLPVSGSESKVLVEVMDKDKITRDDHIGSFMLDLTEIQSKGQVSKWYPLTYKNKPAGELFLESSFQFDGASQNYQQTFQGVGQTGLYEREQERMFSSYPTSTLREEKAFSSSQYGANVGTFERESNLSQFSGSHEGSHVFTEQRQVVEPRTFMKEVDSVEMRPVLKQIEVLEPQRVLKEVLVTEAVPVKREIQITEPQVVKKQVEVIEPRLVTKEIQVIENVPVMKEVEVIEPVTITKEIDTFEPRTFSKQVEVTENVPVLKEVTVTEPVTVKKAVEYVEPIITTKTIVKEIQQPVLVDEKITTTVGPATVVGVETEYRERQFVDKFSTFKVSEEQRLLEEERLRKSNQVGGYSTTTYETNEKSIKERLDEISNKYYGGQKKFY